MEQEIVRKFENQSDEDRDKQRIVAEAFYSLNDKARSVVIRTVLDLYDNEENIAKG